MRKRTFNLPYEEFPEAVITDLKKYENQNAAFDNRPVCSNEKDYFVADYRQRYANLPFLSNMYEESQNFQYLQHRQNMESSAELRIDAEIQMDIRRNSEQISRDWRKWQILNEGIPEVVLKDVERFENEIAAFGSPFVHCNETVDCYVESQNFQYLPHKQNVKLTAKVENAANIPNVIQTSPQQISQMPLFYPTSSYFNNSPSLVENGAALYGVAGAARHPSRLTMSFENDFPQRVEVGSTSKAPKDNFPRCSVCLRPARGQFRSLMHSHCVFQGRPYKCDDCQNAQKQP